MLIKGCLLTGKKVYCVVNNEINRPHKITIFSYYTGFVFNKIFKVLQIFILHSNSMSLSRGYEDVISILIKDG